MNFLLIVLISLIILVILIENDNLIYNLSGNLFKIIKKFTFMSKQNKKLFNYQKQKLDEYGLPHFVNNNPKVITVPKDLVVSNSVKNIENHNIYMKKDSLSLMLDSLTSKYDLFGDWMADSIFRINLEDRGKDNFLKKQYMSALTSDKNLVYKNKINHYLKDKLNDSIIGQSLLNFCIKMTIDLTFLLHFSKLPNYEDEIVIKEFLAGITRNFNKFDFLNHYKNIFKFKGWYKNIQKNIRYGLKQPDCMVRFWADSGMNIHQIYIEYVHNIIGITINWFNLTYNYLEGIFTQKIKVYSEKSQISEISNIENYMLETIRFTCPVKFISSSVKDKDYNILHNLYKLSRSKNYVDSHNFNIKNVKKQMSKCPFSRDYTKNFVNNFYSTKNDEVVDIKEKINIHPDYVFFGKGYRRCPGEILTMIYLEALVKIISENTHLKVKVKSTKPRNMVVNRYYKEYVFAK